MPSLRLTEAVIRKLQCPDKGQTDYFEEGNFNLCLRVGHGGAKTFYLVQRIDGRQRRLKLGRYPQMSLAEARVALREARDRLLAGEGPNAQRQIAFSHLSERYLHEHARRFKRSWKEDARMIKADLLPSFKGVSVHEISPNNVRSCLERIMDRGSPIAANRTLALLRKMFEFALERDLVRENPCARVRAPAKEKPKDRVLSETEIYKLWEALAVRPPWFQGYIKALLFTGQRPEEVLQMGWSEIDMPSRYWMIRSGRVKSKNLHRVPLTQPVLSILKERRLVVGGNEFVFGFESKEGPRMCTYRQMDHLIDAVGEHFTRHDLRRTVATQLASLRVDRTVIGKILNHSDSSVTRVYDRFSYDTEKREALDLWVEKLGKIVLGSEIAA